MRFKPAALVPASYAFVSMNYRFRSEASLANMASDVVKAKGKGHSELDVDMGLEGDETTRSVLSFLDRLSR